MPLTPNNREEHWLQGMVDGQTDLTPNKRREYWYKEIVDAIGSGGGGGGGGGGVLVCTLDGQTGALDKTWKEIYDAPFTVVRYLNSPFETSIGYIYSTSKNPITGECTILVAFGNAESDTVTWYNSSFVATTENDYPVGN